MLVAHFISFSALRLDRPMMIFPGLVIGCLFRLIFCRGFLDILTAFVFAHDDPLNNNV